MIIRKGTLRNKYNFIEVSEDFKEDDIEMFNAHIILHNDNGTPKFLKNNSDIPEIDMIDIKTDEEIHATLLSYLIDFCDNKFKLEDDLSELNSKALNDKLNEFMEQNEVYSHHFPLRYENSHLKSQIDWNGEFKIFPKSKVQNLKLNVKILRSEH